MFRPPRDPGKGEGPPLDGGVGLRGQTDDRQRQPTIESIVARLATEVGTMHSELSELAHRLAESERETAELRAEVEALRTIRRRALERIVVAVVEQQLEQLDRGWSSRDWPWSGARPIRRAS
jgi:chromosome segregation ATPase